MSDKPTQEIKWHSPTTDDLLASAEIDKTMLEVKLAARDLEVKALREKGDALANLLGEDVKDCVYDRERINLADCDGCGAKNICAALRAWQDVKGDPK